jgi:predicted acyl esterase
VKKKRSTWRWMAFVFFPLFFLSRALYDVWKALQGEEVKQLEQEGIMRMPYKRVTHKITSRDGTRLNASVWVPEGEGPFPAVIMVHSWMFSRWQCDLLYAASFARRGYMVLTYTCRGWGTSGDQVHCAAPDKELCDLEDVIDWLVAEEQGFPVDADRLGMTGISYGGGHTYLAATRDPRIKAAVPMNGWTDLFHSLVPNGCWKPAWSIGLFVGGIWAHRFSPKNDLFRWLKTTIIEMKPRKLKDELDTRSAIFDVDKVKCPMFIVHSWNDDLFEPNQVLKFYEKLQVPKKLHISNGLHGFDPARGDVPVPNQIWAETRRWFDYWLKDDRDNDITQEPEVTFFQPWNRKMGTARHWPPEGFADVTYYLGGIAAENTGTLSRAIPEDDQPTELLINNTVSNLQSSGPPMFRPNVLWNLPIPGIPWTIPGDSIAFTTGPFGKDTALVGIPKARIFATSSTTECQLNALLYDVAPKGFCRLVTHSAMMKSDIDAGAVEEFAFELIACAHRFKPGHRAKLVLCASDPLFVFPSLKPSQYRISHDEGHQSNVTLPLMKIVE